MLGGLVAALLGALLAFGASFGLVNSQTAVPSPVNSPYVVYGES
jgi:hypothetical protein